MKPDRWKKELLDDLWRDDDATTRDASLQRMIGVAHRRLVYRRVATVAAGTAILLIASFPIWKPAAPIAPEAKAPQPQKLIAVHHFTEAELKNRLRDVAVAYVGPPGERRVVLLEDAAH